MRITIRDFLGEIPTTEPDKLPQSVASYSLNIDFRSRDLRSWKRPRLITDTPGKACAFFRDAIDGCVPNWHISTDSSMIWSRVAPGSKSIIRSSCKYSDYSCADTADASSGLRTALGVPFPSKQPLVLAAAPGDKESCDEARLYVITYENVCCQESAPSPASQLIHVPPGEAVTINASMIPEGITRVNVYRFQSTWDATEGADLNQENELNQSSIFNGREKVTADGDFFYVGSIESGSTVLVDTVPSTELGHALDTEYFYPPPTGLRGIQYLNTGRVVGFHNDRINFSERNFPHAFPPKGELVFNRTVRAIQTSDNLVFVVTDGSGYVVQDLLECDADTPLPRSIAQTTYNYPIVSEQSATISDRGMLYASLRGLVLMDANAGVTILTETLFDPGDWQALNPRTMQGVWWHDAYVFRTDSVAGMITFREEQPYLYRVSIVPQSWHVSDDRLFMAFNESIYEWDAGSAYMMYRWESPNFKTQANVNWNSTRVMQSDVKDCDVSAQDVTLKLVRGCDHATYKFNSDKPQYVKKVATRHTQLRLSGKRRIEEFSIATNVAELGLESG